MFGFFLPAVHVLFFIGLHPMLSHYVPSELINLIYKQPISESDYD
ncbi:MAG: hypothetical protein PHD97_11655 [Bacteroidales bacterium]|nr:hypothetical protein [Bacteroidales bacterium]